jgi:hypothetical protein
MLAPNTAPKGNTNAPGFTEAFVNTKNLKELFDSSPADLKNALFPLPSYDSGYISCFNISKTINVDLSHKVRMIKSPPWQKKLSRGILSQILGGLIPGELNCIGTATHNKFTVVLNGQPDDITFQSMVLTSEEEHVAIDQALLHRFVESYEDDVKNSPTEFKTILPCRFHLNMMLKRDQYMNAFMTELNRYHRLLDHAHGPHGYRFSVTADNTCNTITVSMRSPGITPAMPSGKKWKPE